MLLLALIAHASPGWSCSLSFTTPARGSTVTSATVGVAGTGSGTANAGDVGTVTATVNGQVFFSQSGRFTTLIQFLGSGAASVTLRPGPNVLQVSGSAGSCSASDQMVVHYTPPPPAAQKAAGAPLVCNGSNPIDGGNGNKFQTERDYTGAGPFPLVFERYYNSQFDSNGTLGPRWRHGYDRRIAATTATAYVFRPDGRALRFGSSGETWFADADVVERLVRLKDDAGKPVGWQFVDADDTVEAYDNSGRLTLITLRGGLSQSLAYDTSGRLVAVTEVPFGRRLAFTYDASNRLESVADPADGIIRFNYDGAGRLISAAYPDSTPEDASDNPVRQYLYEDPRFPLALTGLLDENAERFATWAYGADGRAISSEHAGGVDRYRFTYDAGGGSTVTDPLGAVRTYNYATVLGVPRATGVSQPCTAGCGSQSATVTYDANGNVLTRTDFNGRTIAYSYDLARNLETGRTEAVGTDEQRSVATDWHAHFRVPTRIVTGDQTLGFEYDPFGRLLARTATAGNSKRIWRFGYGDDGQLVRVNGPRTDVRDVTRFFYYGASDTCPTGHPGGCRGQLRAARNAAGHITYFRSYDAHGHVGRIVDPNGVATTLTYDGRGRITRSSTDHAATQFAYDKTGKLLRVTFPAGTYLDLVYDPAHRLTQVVDRAGNRIQYTLDAAGNRVQEDVYDAGNVRVRSQRWTYDALSRLAATIGGSEQTTSYGYDAGGNLTAVTDPASHVWSKAYDALNRLTAATDPAAGVTRYQYDALDRLVQVTDAKGLSTAYSRNGLGDLIRQVSPDTGTTRYTYDAAGNLRSRTVAGGMTASYGYDALNRLVTIDYPGTEADVVYTWDGGSGQKGFLSQARRGPYTVDLTWTPRGKLASVLHAKDGVPFPDGAVRYGYNRSDQLTSIGLGANRDIRYVYGPSGAVRRIEMVKHTTPGDAAGDVVSKVAGGIVHLPFGPVQSLTFGSGLKLQRSFDLDYRMTQQTLGSLQSLAYLYDPLGNVTQRIDRISPVASQVFDYDPLGRLIEAAGPFGTDRYRYDEIGNRLGEERNGESTTYAYGPTRHRLLSVHGEVSKTFRYDASGNLLRSGDQSFAYAPDGRLAQSQQGAQFLASYGFDAFGQRVEKASGPLSTLFEYHPDGRLLRETGRDYVYLDGELLALVDGAALNFVHGNHLGAPVAVTNGARKMIWKAEYEPFGKAMLTNPGLTLNVRLPGQYLDAETGLHYNYFRDYDPTLGRYIQSDPIGLAGGVSTYAYAGNNPINAIDPDGRIPFALVPAANYMFGLFLGGASSAALQYAILGSVDISQTIDDALYGGMIGIINPAFGLSSGLRAAGCTAPSVAPVARSLTNYYPRNNGFIDHGRALTLLPRTRVDRFGFSGGRFLSPEGTPATMRSLPPLSFERPYRKFEVVNPLEVQVGEVAPAFGELGFGTQFVTQESIRKLIASGHLREIRP